MKAESIIGSIISLCIKVIVVAGVVFILFILGQKGYAFGNKVFMEEAADAENIKEVVVDIPKGVTTSQLAQIFKDNGLIEDEEVFKVQTLLSDFRGEIVPGKYVLDTSMKPTQMLEHISSGDFYIDPNEVTQAPNDAEG